MPRLAADTIYRVNYANGQVSGRFGTYYEALADLRAVAHLAGSEDFRIQRYEGDGEWSGLGKKGRLATANRDGV